MILGQLPDEQGINDRGTSQTPTAALSALRLNTNGNSNGTHNEKHGSDSEYEAPQGPPPSATQGNPPPYAQPPPPPAATPAALTHAVALYAYTATDAGDLTLQPNDRIAVTEYMNAEWWKGVSERTREEGIFPRSYVRVEEKSVAPAPPTPASSYGILPVDVAMQPVGGAAPAQPGRQSKLAEGGKKFGKKLGNAAIFGAGATIGSDLVNSIF